MAGMTPPRITEEASSKEMDGHTEAPVAQPTLSPVPGDTPDTAPISRIVAAVVARCPGDRISLGEMAAGFGDRAFGLLVLLLLLPAMIPGMATVFGTPLLILGIQMGLGHRTPKLPAFLARQTVRREDLLKLAGASSNWLRRIERYVKPTPGFFISSFGDRVFGWLTAFCALLLILPGPGTNGPPAFGNIVMALGLVEHDNRVFTWGVVLTVLGCLIGTAVFAGVVWLGWTAMGMVF